MTRDDIIRMAREAEMGFDLTMPTFFAELERFAALVAAAERSQCAALCSRFAARSMSPAECAAAIRAREQA